MRGEWVWGSSCGGRGESGCGEVAAVREERVNGSVPVVGAFFSKGNFSSGRRLSLCASSFLLSKSFSFCASYRMDEFVDSNAC